MNHIFLKTKKRLQLGKHAIAKLAMTNNQLQRIEGGKRLMVMSTVGAEPRCTSNPTASNFECVHVVIDPL